MPEILTESFCERCGTRYAFETGAPQTKRPTVAKARVLVRGLRNFVMSNDPLEAALADARRDDERGRAAAQMEAFHHTFNFCMDCRQYTCTSCWNEVDGRCLTCAPMPGRIETAMATLEPIAVPLPEASANGHDREEAWPTIDLPAVEAPVAIVEAATVAAEPEPAAVVEAQAAPAVDSVVEAAPDAYLPELLTPVELPGEEPAEVQGAAAPEPEAAAVEPEAGVVQPPTAPEAPLVPPAPPRVAPAWTMVAPDAPSAEPTPAWPPQAPVYRPPAALPRPTPSPAAPVPSWPRPATPASHGLPPAPSVWEESSVGVINRPGSGVQACFSCGLPLSASARFCRRCGSRQE